MKRLRISAVVLFVLMCSIAAAAEHFKPRLHVADLKPKIDLEKQVPDAFGDWVIDKSVVPVAPSPEVQAKLNSLYSATLSRTYRDSAGHRVMLSIAYGSDQSSEATAVHRPEFCYSAQGFKVNSLGGDSLPFSNSYNLPVRRLLATLGHRYEPITYWITLDEEATTPGIGRKLEQLRYGLKGRIPDGLLFRVSTVGLTEEEAFRVQDDFVRSLYAVFDKNFRNRYFGAPARS